MDTLAQVNAWLVEPQERDLVPVLPALRSLIPGGGLRPGTVVCAEGSVSLGLALAAGPAQAGDWCAVVGMPESGILAAEGYGVDPHRLLLVDDPGRRWADVVAALADGCALVLTRPPARPDPAAARRLTALARRHGCVLVMAGPWEGAHLRLRIEAAEWTGVADGNGHLRGRRALVAVSGRGAAGPGRRAWLWLPGPDGSVAPWAEVADDAPAANGGNGQGLGGRAPARASLVGQAAGMVGDRALGGQALGGQALGGQALDGPALDGPALDGPALGGPASGDPDAGDPDAGDPDVVRPALAVAAG